MFIEALFSICFVMVVICSLVGFMINTVLNYGQIIGDMGQKIMFNQLRMLVESDLFVRRRSEFSVATNGKERFCIGFWEQSDGEKKYLIYDFLTLPASSTIIKFYRSCFNQDALTSLETSSYCWMLISKISKGEYEMQNQPKYIVDYSQFCQGHIEEDGDLIKLKLGDYRYAF